MGGLGNQLFQYATAYSISKLQKTELVLDKRFFDTNNQHGGYRLEKLNIPNLSVVATEHEKPKWKVNLITKIPMLDWIIDTKIIHESRFQGAHTIPDHALLLGYWQDSKYFSQNLKEFREFFVPVSITSKVSSERLEMQKLNSVSVHIRRGDYITNPEALRNHGICSIAYYTKAINYVLEKVKNPTFYIFSDDVSWVEDNLAKLFKANDSFYMIGNSQEEDLWLMSNAKHHIVANSSFSWWGAYLASGNKQIVVSPFPWFDIPQKYTVDPSLSGWKRVIK